MQLTVKLLIRSLFFLAYSYVNAQSSQKGMNIHDHLLRRASDKYLYSESGKKVIGSPYLSETFVEGKVNTSKGNYVAVPMRYDIYNDVFEFSQNSVIYLLDPTPQILKISLPNQVMVVEKFEYKGKLRFGFLLLLDSGSLSLMAQKVVTFREEQAPKALESSSTPAKYSSLPDIYYYKIGQGEVKKVENINKLIGSLPDKHKELEKFVKQWKLSSRKQDDLIKLVRYYNSL